MTRDRRSHSVCVHGEKRLGSVAKVAGRYGPRSGEENHNARGVRQPAGRRRACALEFPAFLDDSRQQQDGSFRRQDLPELGWEQGTRGLAPFSFRECHSFQSIRLISSAEAKAELPRTQRAAISGIEIAACSCKAFSRQRPIIAGSSGPVGLRRGQASPRKTTVRMKLLRNGRQTVLSSDKRCSVHSRRIGIESSGIHLRVMPR